MGKLSEKILHITSCEECPFCFGYDPNDRQGCCNHPFVESDIAVSKSSVPKKCPIRKVNLTIKIVK